MVSQQYRVWSDCTDVQAGLALYWWQRLITFGVSRIRVEVHSYTLFKDGQKKNYFLNNILKPTINWSRVLKEILFMATTQCSFHVYLSGLPRTYKIWPKSVDTEWIINIIKFCQWKRCTFHCQTASPNNKLGVVSVHFILKKSLKLRKISARWTPHLLTAHGTSAALIGGRTQMFLRTLEVHV